MRIVALVIALAGFKCVDESLYLYRMPEPALAAGAWAAALACSHVTPQPGGDLADVKWFASDLSAQVSPRLYAAWLPPDTIVLDLRHLSDSVTIEHELLHHLLRGAVNGEAHPFNPFIWPCNVIAPQVGG